MSLRRQLVSYGLVGAVNTAVTAVVIAIMALIGLNLVAANAIGFAAGLANSFILNSAYTFGSEKRGKFLPFLSSFAVAYALNLLAVLFASHALAVHDLTAQAIGMITYNIAFFILMKVWVFARAA